MRRLALFSAGAAVAAVPLVLGMNALRTGNPLDAGYGGEGTLASLLVKPWYGWFGILLSPGCGLVPHAPLMAVGLLALTFMWEDDPAPALVAGAAALGSIAYYGSLSTTWCAYATWGPRYFVALAPLMALPLAVVWARLPGGGRNPFVLLIGGGVFLWSAAANLLAVLIDFNRGLAGPLGPGRDLPGDVLGALLLRDHRPRPPAADVAAGRPGRARPLPALRPGRWPGRGCWRP